MLTEEQMTKAIAERPNRRLSYQEENSQYRGEALAADINDKITALKSAAKRDSTNLYDLKAIQERTFAYMRSCAAAEAFPSVMGLAALGFGCSRQYLNKFIREHPEAESSKFIELTKDVFADLLTNNALFRRADCVQAIFQLKNNHSFADRLEIVPEVKTDPLGELVDPEALRKRIEDNIVIDDEDY